MIVPSFCAASFRISLCSSSKLTSVPDRTTYSWKRFVLNIYTPKSICLCFLWLIILCLSSWQHGQQLYRHIYLGCKEQSSGRQHYETLFALLGLLSVELANEEVVVDLIRLALALQVPMRMMCHIFTCLFCLETNMTLAVTTAKTKTWDETRQTFFKMSHKTNNK